MASLLSQSVSAIGLRVLGSGASYLSLVLAARWLAPPDYGHFSAVLGVVTLLAAVAALGMPIILLRYLAQYRVSGDTDLSGAIIRQSRRVTLACSGALALVGLLVALSTSDPRAVTLGLGLVLLPPFVLVEVNGAVLRAEGKIVAALAPRDILWRLCLIPVAAVIGGSLPAGAQIVPYLSAAAALLWACAAGQALMAGREMRRGAAPPDVRREWRLVAGRVWLTNVAAVGISNIDVVLVGLIFSPVQTGLYFAASRTAGLASFTLNAVALVIAPRVARSFHAGDRPALRRDLRIGATLAFVPALMSFLAFVIFGGPILELFGPGFAEMRVELILLALGQLVNGLTGGCGILLNMSGREGLHAAISMAFLVLSVVAALAGAMLNGTVGVAAGMLCAVSGLNLTLWWAARRVTGEDTSVLAWFSQRSVA